MLYDNSIESWAQQGFIHVIPLPHDEFTDASYQFEIEIPGGDTSTMIAEFPAKCAHSIPMRRHVKQAASMFLMVCFRD